MPNTNTYDEFTEINNNSNYRLEYIDEMICMSPSPSIPHQRIRYRYGRYIFRCLKINN